MGPDWPHIPLPFPFRSPRLISGAEAELVCTRIAKRTTFTSSLTGCVREARHVSPNWRNLARISNRLRLRRKPALHRKVATEARVWRRSPPPERHFETILGLISHVKQVRFARAVQEHFSYFWHPHTWTQCESTSGYCATRRRSCSAACLASFLSW